MRYAFLMIGLALLFGAPAHAEYFCAWGNIPKQSPYFCKPVSIWRKHTPLSPGSSIDSTKCFGQLKCAKSKGTGKKAYTFPEFSWGWGKINVLGLSSQDGRFTYMGYGTSNAG
jgi:hypothetical protein